MRLTLSNLICCFNGYVNEHRSEHFSADLTAKMLPLSRSCSQSVDGTLKLPPPAWHGMIYQSLELWANKPGLDAQEKKDRKHLNNILLKHCKEQHGWLRYEHPQHPYLYLFPSPDAHCDPITCHLSTLPAGMWFAGDLWLDGFDFTKLSCGFRVEKDLKITNCRNLNALAPDLWVGNDLWIENCPIHTIPIEFFNWSCKTNGFPHVIRLRNTKLNWATRLQILKQYCKFDAGVIFRKIQTAL